MLIDTHAHLNFQAFEEDFEEVLKRAQDEGVGTIINVGADLSSSQKAVEMAQKYERCYASVGIHPHHAEETLKNLRTEELRNRLEKLARQPKVVAIGECGLDHHPYENGGIADPQKQKELFLNHLDLAQKLNLPIIFHCREAHDDILEIVAPYILDPKPYPLTGVFHCFSGDRKFLETILEMGFYAGFDGNITYKPRVSPRFSSEASQTNLTSKSAQNLREMVEACPLEKLLLETDCPYLSPEPFRGLRNEPKNVKIIAGTVAEIKRLPFQVVGQQTTQNARRLFRFNHVF